MLHIDLLQSIRWRMVMSKDGGVMKKKITLNAGDWIKGGFRALTKGGPEAIKVEAIAREMEVSKGSFYWHFKDVGALKKAMLEHWAQLATYGTIEEIESKVGSGRERLFALVRLATGSQKEQYGGVDIEVAIRGWARFDENAAQMVKKIEMARLNFVGELFEQAGQSKEQSRQNARLLYGAMIGLEQLPGAAGIKVRKDLKALLEQLCPMAE